MTAGDRADPEREHVQLGERHVARADHQRDEEVAEASDQDRHHHEEDHDGGVHREHRVVGVGRDRAVVHERLGHPVKSGNRGFRKREFPSHQHRHQAADRHHEQRHEQELAPDHLVIFGKNVRAHEAELMMLRVSAVCRNRCRATHLRLAPPPGDAGECGCYLFCAYWSLSHLSKSSCDCTVRLPFIPECPKPHSCEHGISYCPVSVASNQT